MAGKIKTLFSDKEKTEPLFPRTKTSAVSADDGTGLDVLLEHVGYYDESDGTGASVPIDADSLGGLPADNFASKDYVAVKIAEASMEGSDVDLSGYATKDELNAIDFPVDSVNGMTGAVQLSATDVGAPTTDYVDGVSHFYRGSYSGYIDGTDLNGLYWIVSANCTGTFPTNHTYYVLEATGRHQKLLAYSNDGIAGIYERYYANSDWYDWKRTDSINSVPTSRTINGKELSSNITLSAADVGAPTISESNIGKLTRLWTNSSPTSSFAAQTVSLDLSEYDYVIVCATWDINNPHRTLPCHIARVGGTYNGGYLGGRNPSSGVFVGRSMDVTTSGVTFADAYKDTASNNQVCIPFAIFGTDI